MVKRIHGNNGEMLLKSLTDREERFFEGSELYLTRKRETDRTKVRITGFRNSGRGPLVFFEGYNSRDEAKALFGASLFVPGSEIGSIGEASFFAFQIEGCQVYEGDRKVGTVTKLVESAKATPYIEVETVAGVRPILIPFISQVIRQVDVDGQRIDIIEGFLG